MKKTILFFLMVPFVAISGNSMGNSDGFGETKTTISVVNFKQLQPLLEKENDTVYVVNFWATWCAPCVQEIPHFEQLGSKYKDKMLKVIMVSLDMPSQMDTRLLPFIQENNMRNEVVLLDDPKFNDWIPLVDRKWTGAIPATLIYGRGFREFFPSELTLSELEEAVHPLLLD